MLSFTGRRREVDQPYKSTEQTAVPGPQIHMGDCGPGKAWGIFIECIDDEGATSPVSPCDYCPRLACHVQARHCGVQNTDTTNIAASGTLRHLIFLHKIMCSVMI
ncbi:hypothetical protein GCK32_019527 [Trichostrongylus colubriformis]|uniref:Uncharacterized protein n=1 Tax=Trichostrongylus colubriformis TaxID=6319 RepID=A0AAN8IKZ5_TRICO